MIKQTLIIALLIATSACTQETKTSEFSDDYVLIEFAARLEEDHQLLYAEPLANSTQKPTE